MGLQAVRIPRGGWAQEQLGRRLAAGMVPGMVVHLRGEIGAGKTALTRGLLRGLGVVQPVKSPTYTLVEPYEGPHGPIYHFDLYRLAAPEELHFFGAEEYFSEDAICILEWVERGGDVLASPDLFVHIEYRDAESRKVGLRGLSEAGEKALAELVAQENG